MMKKSVFALLIFFLAVAFSATAATPTLLFSLPWGATDEALGAY